MKISGYLHTVAQNRAVGTRRLSECLTECNNSTVAENRTPMIAPDGTQNCQAHPFLYYLKGYV